LEELFRLVKDELRKAGRDAQLPAGIILTGGGAKIPGIDDLAKECFSLPAEVARPHSLSGLTDKAYDPRMSTAVGLMLYAFEEGYNTGGSNPTKDIVGKIRKIIKIFLP
jgi:cell division protein FtsA